MTETQPPPEPPGALRRTARVVFVVELAIGALTVMVILAMVFLQALQRYLPIEGFPWTGELSRFSLVWLTFSAAGLLVTSRGHIALEIVDAIPNAMAVRAINVFALAVVAATGVGLAAAAWDLVQTQAILKSPVLRLPMSWIYVPVLIGAMSTAIRASIAAIDVALHGPRLGDAEPDEREATA